MEKRKRPIKITTDMEGSKQYDIDLALCRPAFFVSAKTFNVEIPCPNCGNNLCLKFIQGLGTPEINATVFKSLRERNHPVSSLKVLSQYFEELKFDEYVGVCVWSSGKAMFAPLLLAKKCGGCREQTGVLFSLQFTEDKYHPLPKLLIYDYNQIFKEPNLSVSPFWGDQALDGEIDA